jgi:cell wall-associated NlpC family hydrolase/DNA-binding protein YbaB
MPRRHHTPFVLTALAVLALAPIPNAFSQTLADVQTQVERTSAQLAQARTRAESDTGAAQAAAIGSGRDLELSKSELIDRENVLEKEAVAAAKAAAAQVAATEAQLASGASTASLVPHASDAFGSGLAATKGLESLTSLPAVPAATGGVDAAALDAYLVGVGSPLAGAGAAFVASAGQVGLDPRMLVAISGAETSFGTYGPSQLIHNPFGMGPGRVYPSWEEAIAAAAGNLAGPLYLGAGKVTIGQISGTWAPLGAVNDPNNLNANWTRNVSRYYAEMGGDPASSVFSSSSSLAPGPVGSVIGTQVAMEALTHLGKPYVWGGESPVTGFDCSGLVKYLYAQHGVALPRVADAQARVGTSIPPSALQAGDAVFFADSSGYIGHEGLYVGNGQFVHAPHSGDVVKVSSLLDPGYSARYAGARRYA